MARCCRVRAKIDYLACLAALQREGRPVFVYFTADWCVTCKGNEKGALERRRVADAEIGRFLGKHGRTGVPLYLYYAPGKPPQILPQVLTTSRLVSLVS